MLEEQHESWNANEMQAEFVEIRCVQEGLLETLFKKKTVKLAENGYIKHFPFFFAFS